jgi:hypothetical protein
MEPRKSAVKALFCNSVPKGDVNGYAELDDHDGLKEDNRFYFRFDAADKAKLLCVDGDPKLSQFLGDTFFLRTALAAEGSSGQGFIPTACVPSELEWKNLEDYRAIFICNAGELSETSARRLKDYLKNGGNLVYFPGDRVNVQKYEGLDPDIFPAKFIQLESGEASVNVFTVDRNHRLFKTFDETGFAKAKFYKYYNIMPASGAVTLMSFSDGLSFLIEKTFKNAGYGRVLVFAVPADRDWSDLPLKPVYVPFIQELARYLSGAEEQELQKGLVAGEPYRKSFAGKLAPKRAEIIRPDGAVIETPVYGDVLEFKDTPFAGIYKARFSYQGALKTEYFAVNLDTGSGESDLKKADLDAVKKSMPESRVFLIRDFNNISAELMLIMRGREISRLLLVLAALLLAAESYISLRRPG